MSASSDLRGKTILLPVIDTHFRILGEGTLDIKTPAQSALTVEADAILIFLFEGEPALPEPVSALDTALNGAIRELLELGDFSGKSGQSQVILTRGALPAKRLILVGMGKRDKYTPDSLRRAAGTGVRKSHEVKAAQIGVVFYEYIEGISTTEAAHLIVEGALLGRYEYRGQKSGEAPAGTGLPNNLQFLTENPAFEAELQAGTNIGLAFAAGAIMARDLVNLPPNICTPAYLAQHAREMAESAGLRCDVLEEQQMRALKMGAVLAVSQGSDTPPRFIVLEHNAQLGADADTLVLVGKGVTFDTGGYSLKPADGMVGMKADMAGAAAVIGAMGTIAALKIPLHVVGVVPAVDNMISGHAYRPQEVITASNGKTIEIISTDAEGRLILADALVYARRFNPAAVVDIATLTGACVVALGKAAAGLFSIEEGLRDVLLKAADQTAERLWPMPVYADYEKLIESDTADMKNSSGARFAGASVGAVFLRNFVDYPAWAHIDMAGMMQDLDGISYVPAKGASGYGARLLAEFARQWAQASAQSR